MLFAVTVGYGGDKMLDGANIIATAVYGLFDHIGYTIDGVPTTKSISNHTITNGVISIYFTIPDTENGYFRDFKIIDKNSDTLISRLEEFQKTSGEQMVCFQTNLREVS
jgi:hypothetical protein